MIEPGTLITLYDIELSPAYDVKEDDCGSSGWENRFFDGEQPVIVITRMLHQDVGEKSHRMIADSIMVVTPEAVGWTLISR